jgi:peptidoglycan/xylan/chitin deacetylase (PgdA/CDA1 family)
VVSPARLAVVLLWAQLFASCGGGSANQPQRHALGGAGAQLRVDAGEVTPLANGKLAIFGPTIRASLIRSDLNRLEVSFVYRGPTRASAPLASGELRRQIGLKVRAQNTCNVVYVMWYIEPGAGLHVSLKSNPGLTQHSECHDHGYAGIEPDFVAEVAPIKVGEPRRLAVELVAEELRVFVDGALSWKGKLPPAALALEGPFGLRTDNAELELELSTGDASTSCSDLSPSAFSKAHPLGLGYVEDIGKLPPRVAYLTFDDGPSEWTADFLDLLRDARAPSTFFVVARGAKGPDGLDGTYVDAHGATLRYRDVLARIVESGHAIGNHTADHRDLGTLEPAQIAGQLDENEALVNRALVQSGVTPRFLTLIRPPFGSPWRSHTETRPDALRDVGSVIAERGLNALWDIDSTDSREWAQGETLPNRPMQVRIASDAPTLSDKVSRIVETVLGAPAVKAGLGVIVLFHDTHSATLKALPELLKGLKAAGYRFDTLDQLVLARWGRSAFELTPGPQAYAPCVAQRDWGCERFAASAPRASSYEVCGRLWRQFQNAGGEATLGVPLGPAESDAFGGMSQRFERGRIELEANASRTQSQK